MKNSICFLLLILLSSFTPLIGSELDLSVYHDASLKDCKNNIPCSRLARWQCMASACMHQGNQRPTDCYVNFTADKDVANRAICLAEILPNEENIQAVIEAIPGAQEADVVQGLMMMQAILGNDDLCQEGIKEYVTSNEITWTTFWTGAMEGCRILSKSAKVK